LEKHGISTENKGFCDKIFSSHLMRSILCEVSPKMTALPNHESTSPAIPFQKKHQSNSHCTTSHQGYSSKISRGKMIRSDFRSKAQEATDASRLQTSAAAQESAVSEAKGAALFPQRLLRGQQRRREIPQTTR